MSEMIMDSLDTTDRPADMDNEGGMPEDLTLPPKRYEKLNVNGEDYDLRKAEDAEAAQEATKDYRQRLYDGELDEYEDRITEPGNGGRIRLWYDELRAQLATDFHDGKHTLTYDQQHDEAQRIMNIRMQQNR